MAKTLVKRAMSNLMASGNLLASGRRVGAVVLLAAGVAVGLGSPASAQVVTVGNVATGTSDLSGGVTNQGATPDFTTPPVDTLNINNLTQDIAPASGTPGIEFFGPTITLNLDTGMFAIVTDAASGVSAGSAGANTSLTIFTTNSTINTTGDNAVGFSLVPIGASSTQSFTANGIAVMTQGANSAAFENLGELQSSARGTTVNNSSLSTSGDDSAGLAFGAVGAGSSASQILNNVTITTEGDRSAGFQHGGQNAATAGGSGQFIELNSVTISTDGIDSDGVTIASLASDNGSASYSFEDSSITTNGINSAGLVIGEQTSAAVKGSGIDGTSVSVSVTGTNTVTTTAANSAGVIVNGLGDGAVDSDSLIFIQDLDVETQAVGSTGVVLNAGSEGASNSDFTTALDGVRVRTNGDDATGLELNTGGANAINSQFTTAFEDIVVRTEGDDATGLIVNSGAGLPPAGAGTTYTTGFDAVDVETTGDRSDGIVIGSGLGLDNGGTNTLTIGPDTRVVTSGADADGVVIQPNSLVDLPATVTASGANSNGVMVESSTQAISLGLSGPVQGGSGTGAGVNFAGGVDNTLNIAAGGSLTALSGVAVRGVGADDTVNNAGVLTGSVLLGGGVNGLNNLSGGLFAAGPMVELGGGLLSSAGVFTPGGDGTAQVVMINGDLALQAGGVFNVDILADGSSDLVQVDGVATLAGTIFVNGVMFPAGFPESNEFTVLTAPGAIGGMFDSVVDNLPDVDAVVTVLPPSGTDPAKVVVSYEISADTSDKAIVSNAAQFGSQIGLAFVETLQRRARLYRPCSHDGKSIWQEGIGGGQNVSAAGATGYSGGYGGYAAGFEQCVSASDGSLRYGLAGAYTGGGLTSGVSQADLNAGQIGVYTSLNMNSGLLLSTALSYGFLDYDIERRIPIAGGSPLTAAGEAGGGVLAFSASGSYNLAHLFGYSPAFGFRVAPIVRFDWLDSRRSAYRESSAGVLDLDLSAADFESGLISYGLELGRQKFTAGGLPISALFDIRYEHLVGDRNAVTTSVLQTVGGTPFTDPGTLERRDRVAMGVGAEAQVSQNVSIHGRYDTAFRGRSGTHRAAGGVTVRY